MTAKLRKTTARLIAATRRIASALVTAIRGRAFRLTADLYRAIDAGQTVEITYVKPDGTESVRVIEPQELTLSAAGNVSVRAYDELRGEDRTFRLDRITAADFQRCA